MVHQIINPGKMSIFDKRSTLKSEWAVNIRHRNGSARLHVLRSSEHFGRTGYFRHVRGEREENFFCEDRFNISSLVSLFIFPRLYLTCSSIKRLLNTYVVNLLGVIDKFPNI
jgi:hypothetical protein